MEIVTSWKKEGLEEGLVQGEQNLLLRLLPKQVGRLPAAAVKQIEASWRNSARPCWISPAAATWMPG